MWLKFSIIWFPWICMWLWIAQFVVKSLWNPTFLPPANVVCEGYVFTGVCLSTRGVGRYPSMHCRLYANMPCSRSPRGVVSQHALQVSRPTTRGGNWGGSSQGGVGSPGHTQGRSWGGSCRGGLQAHTRGGLSQHALRQTPLPRWLLLRAVPILLECILLIVK